jgi:hypothetical protein
MGGARIMKEVGELELGDGVREGKLQEPYYEGECVKMVQDQNLSRMSALAALVYIEFGARACTKKKVLPTKGS